MFTIIKKFLSSKEALIVMKGIWEMAVIPWVTTWFERRLPSPVTIVEQDVDASNTP